MTDIVERLHHTGIKRPATAVCRHCVLWNEPTRECRSELPIVPDNPGPSYWPKTRPDDWCGRFSDDWNNVKYDWSKAAAAE